MVQTGFPLFLDANTLTVYNDSTTTAITAGDGVYATGDDKFGSTYATARSSYAAADITVKAIKWLAIGYKTVCGVALTDIPLSGYGTIALNGIFLHRAEDNLIDPGCPIRFTSTTANKLEIDISAAGTTRTKYCCGRALTGGTAADKIVAWKMSL